MATRTKQAYSLTRYSHHKQRLGSSEERQLQRAKEWVDSTNGKYVLSDLKFSEMRSAFRGANILQGQLGDFILLVEKGKIKKGSALIIEALDRASRAELQKSITVIMSILNAGIDIVTLKPPKHYQSGKVSQIEALQIVVELAGSHQESEFRSDRIKRKWEEDRKNGLFTQGKLPAWLKRNSAKEIVPIKERAETVKLIFQLFTKSDFSIHEIVRYLNAEGVKTFGRSEQWNTNYVSKILHWRAVLGFTKLYNLEHKEVEDTLSERTVIRPFRKLVDDDEKKVFPPIIDYKLFNAARIKLQKVRKLGRGASKSKSLEKGIARKKHIPLFSSDILKCYRCGSPMYVVQKQSDGKERRYQCSSYRSKIKGCCSSSATWRITELESLFIQFCQNEVDLSKDSRDFRKQDELSAFKTNLKTRKSELKVAKKEVTEIATAIAKEDGRKDSDSELVEIYREQFREAKSRVREIELEIVSYEEQMTKVDDRYKVASVFDKTFKGIKKLPSDLSDKVRINIRNLIYEMVDAIVVAPARCRQDFQKMSESQWSRFLKRHRLSPAKTDQNRLRCFWVKFKSLPQIRMVRGFPQYYGRQSLLLEKTRRKV